MKDYQHNKLPKNPKYLAVVRKTINNYRIKEDLSFDDISAIATSPQVGYLHFRKDLINHF